MKHVSTLWGRLTLFFARRLTFRPSTSYCSAFDAASAGLKGSALLDILVGGLAVCTTKPQECPKASYALLVRLGGCSEIISTTHAIMAI